MLCLRLRCGTSWLTSTCLSASDTKTTTQEFCPYKRKICTLKTRADTTGILGDDTGLNSVEVGCCEWKNIVLFIIVNQLLRNNIHFLNMYLCVCTIIFMTTSCEVEEVTKYDLTLSSPRQGWLRLSIPICPETEQGMTFIETTTQTIMMSPQNLRQKNSHPFPLRLRIYYRMRDLL